MHIRSKFYICKLELTMETGKITGFVCTLQGECGRARADCRSRPVARSKVSAAAANGGTPRGSNSMAAAAEAGRELIARNEAPLASTAVAAAGRGPMSARNGTPLGSGRDLPG